jgi:hypothetical protein
VERERGRITGKFFKNLLLPCLCICRGEEAAQCRSKRHRAGFFFFFRKGNQNLGVTQNWVMTLMFFFGYVSVDFFPFLFPFVFAFCFCNSLFFFYVSFFMFLVLN